MIFKQDNFTGGIAEGSRAGYKGAVQDMIGGDYRTDPDKLSALKRLKKDSGTNVTDLVKWIVEYNGDFWMYGDTGKIYKRTSAGVYSNPKTVSDSHGNGLIIFNTISEDALWYASDTQIGRAITLQGTTVFKDNFFKSNTSEVDQSAEATGNTYTTTTAINEGATHKRGFVPTVDNLTGVVFVMAARGTGDVTFLVHDSSNNKVAELKVANADLPASPATIRMDFTGKYDLTIGASYHIHIYSTVADAQVYTGTANDLSTGVYATLYAYNDSDVDLSQDYSGTVSISNTYAIPAIGTNAVSELATDRCQFEPNKSSLAAISVQFDTQGTADITLVVHDSKDKVIGSVTITDASFGTGSRRGGFHRFEFATPLKVIPGAAYHFHVYGSVTGSSLVTSTNSDLSTVSYLTHFAILNNDEDFHTMKEFGNLLLIANGNSIATIDDSEVFDPERLTFLRGEKARAIEVIGSLAVISTWRGDDIGDYGTSNLYFWDGTSPTFTDIIPVYGQTHALINDSNNSLLPIHGTEGFISIYTGRVTPLRQLKGIEFGTGVDIYPGAVTLWNRLVLIGISGGDSEDVDRVIWTYGTLNKDYPTTLNKDYTISTLNRGNTVQIGCLLGVNSSTLFASWKDGADYGVDIIDTATDQQAIEFTTLRIDADKPNNQKTSKDIGFRCSPLQSGDSITISYRLNNTGDFVELQTWLGADDTNLICSSYPFVKNWYEVEFKIEMSTTNPEMFDFISFVMSFEMNEEIALGDTTANDGS